MTEKNSEFRKLEELKAELVQRVNDLQDELKNAQNNVTPNRYVDNLLKLFNDRNYVDDSSIAEKGFARLCNNSEFVLGVQFKDVQKNWSYDNIYHFNAQVVTKSMQFKLELIVNVKDVGEDEIQGINCHFDKEKESYMKEILPWIQRFSRDKHFSYLISAASDYTEQSTIRTKILSLLKSKGYVTLDKCPNGGILIYVHPPGATDNILLEFQWFMKFVDKTWRIEHYFVIDPIAEDKFITDNVELLQSFCRFGLRKKDLVELWDKLCAIIDNNK